MSAALTKISVEAIRHLLSIPEDVEIEVAPENEDGLVCLIVTHDSIPDDCLEVGTVVDRELFQHERVKFNHFLPVPEAAAIEA